MPTQQETLIAAFRQEMEDLISAMETRFYLNQGVAYDDQGTQFVENGVPYATTAEVLTMIPSGMRKDYRTVNVAGVEYWFISGNLVQKVASMAIGDASITLAKIINIGAKTFIGNKEDAAGVPQVMSIADVMTMLGLDGVTFTDFVTAVSGKSLVSDTEIAKIHESGSDDQDLSGLVEKVEGQSLMTDAEREKLEAESLIYAITLPSASTVQGRCAGAVEGIDFPLDWTIAGDGVIPEDLVITHNLGKKIAHVTVKSVDGTTERLIVGSEAYAGYYSVEDNVLHIESLAGKEYAIVIHLIFA